MTEPAHPPEVFQRWYLSPTQSRRIVDELRRWGYELAPVVIPDLASPAAEPSFSTTGSSTSTSPAGIVDFEASAVATETEALVRSICDSEFAGKNLPKGGVASNTGGSKLARWMRRDCQAGEVREVDASAGSDGVSLVFAEAGMDVLSGAGQIAELCRSVVCGGAIPLAALAVDWRQTGTEGQLVPHVAECSALGIDLFQSTTTALVDVAPVSEPRWLVVGVVQDRDVSLSPSFVGEGDSILLLGDPVDRSEALQGLGRSLWWTQIRRSPDSGVASVDLQQEVNGLDGLRMLLLGGRIRSAVACGRGGVAWSVIAGVLGMTQSIGALIDLSELLSAEAVEGVSPVRWDATWFGEARGRVLVTTAALDAGKVLAQARILGIPAALVGRTGGDGLRLRIPAGEVVWPLESLKAMVSGALEKASPTSTDTVP